MLNNSIKSLGLQLISAGLRAPENTIDRFVEFSIFKSLLDVAKINCVIDVGANDGQFARNIRNVGYKGRLVSFEPIPHIFQKLEERFRLDKNWKGYCMALGSSGGEGRLLVPDSTVHSSFLASIENHSGMREVAVRIDRLDGLISEIGSGSTKKAASSYTTYPL